jgi:hypothetical protein
MTGFAPIMLTIWGALIVITIIVNMYQSRLARDEDDQLILAESFAHVKAAQTAVMERVNRVQPIKRTAMWLTGAMTLFVIGYYVLDIVKQFQ